MKNIFNRLFVAIVLLSVLATACSQPTAESQTTGRGRNDRYNRYNVPIKDIYIYPLNRHYQQILRGDR